MNDDRFRYSRGAVTCQLSPSHGPSRQVRSRKCHLGQTRDTSVVLRFILCVVLYLPAALLTIARIAPRGRHAACSCGRHSRTWVHTSRSGTRRARGVALAARCASNTPKVMSSNHSHSNQGAVVPVPTAMGPAQLSVPGRARHSGVLGTTFA